MTEKSKWIITSVALALLIILAVGFCIRLFMPIADPLEETRFGFTTKEDADYFYPRDPDELENDDEYIIYVELNDAGEFVYYGEDGYEVYIDKGGAYYCDFNGYPIFNYKLVGAK